MAEAILLNPQWRQMQSQQVAEVMLTVAAQGTQPAQDAVAGAVKCSQSVQAVSTRCTPQLASNRGWRWLG